MSLRDFIPAHDDRWRRVGRWWMHLDTFEFVPVIAGGMVAVSVWDQTRARWRNDDGSETTATWRTIESDGNAGSPRDTVALDTNIRIRFQVDETSGTAGTLTPQLRYSLNGGAYTDVTASSIVARASASSQITDGVATTAQLTAATGTFVAGSIDEVDGLCANVIALAGQYTEVEYVIQFRSADIAIGDTVALRVYNAAAVLDVYSKTPQFIAGVSIRTAGAGGTNDFDTANPTTSATQVLKAEIRANDDLYCFFTSRDHTSSDADPTCTDDEGAGTWAKVGQSSDKKLNLFWKKASANTASKTLTVSGAIGSLAGGVVVTMGAWTGGDPTTNMTLEQNAAGDETMAGITPTNANSHVFASIHNYGSSVGNSTWAWATLGTAIGIADQLSSGGSGSHASVLGRISPGGPTATGAFTWAQTDATTWTAEWAVSPTAVSTSGFFLMFPQGRG